jgi:hypothetical protein
MKKKGKEMSIRERGRRENRGMRNTEGSLL